jgi:hypothetical protein
VPFFERRRRDTSQAYEPSRTTTVTHIQVREPLPIMRNSRARVHHIRSEQEYLQAADQYGSISPGSYADQHLWMC